MTLPFVDCAGTRPWPPRVTEFTRPFWEALAAGRLMTTRGRRSGRLTFPPKPFCPHDWDDAVEWVELSGRGTLYSQTVIHAAPAVFTHEAPLRNGIVDLEEGLRVAARIVSRNGNGRTVDSSTVDEGPVPLDSPVECVVLRYADGPLFGFRPAG